MTEPRPLEPHQLCRRCDPAKLGFSHSGEIAEVVDSVGQDRAIEAARLAIDMKRAGFNLFVLGHPGYGRHRAIRHLLQARAAGEPSPGDWCYVNNFAEPDKPRLLHLPPGMGQVFKRDMQEFVAELGPAIAAALESDEFRTRIEAIQEEFKERHKEALRQLGQSSSEQGIALLGAPQGFIFAPMKDGEPIVREEFEKLPEEERKHISQLIEEFGERLHKLLHQFPRWRREMQTRIRQASRDAMQLAVGHLVEDLKEHYTSLPNVLEFLDRVMRDVIEMGDELRPQSKGDSDGMEVGGTISLDRYQVNLFVDHGAAETAPVVFEDNPVYANLVGRVDQMAHMGTLVTNFTMIRAGTLHRTNGGYLMLDALKVLTQPYAWEGLKRALKSGQIRIESLGQWLGLATTVSLEPEPMPLNVKVVLVGDRTVYYLLRAYDPEFDELFKVAADFEDRITRNDDNDRRYAGLIATLARGGDMRPFEAGAVARVIDHAARLASDAERLSTSTRSIADLMHEADHRAGVNGHERIAREDVEAALAARIRRVDRLRGVIHEQVQRGIQLIAVDGAEIGQVNGLAVFDLGDDLFGHPVRITATARVGEGDVIDIERESELGGSIHSKGVMILASFLAARYSRTQPLSLTASLVFEQSYGPVEGDSASLAESCALLSALGAMPIRQSLAITGSMNQHGAVQAIGGVNEKIEGFFDVCAARGLTGEQGVIIPASNVQHLMLRDDVVAACAQGRFQVWPVSTIDEAISLLTGLPWGEPDEQGLVPEGSVNYVVATQLAAMTVLRQSFAGIEGKRRHLHKKKKDEKPNGPPDAGR